MLWFLIATVVILFMPIRLKVTFLFQDGLIHIYIFNWRIKLKKKVVEEEVNAKNVKKAERFLDKFLPKDIKAILMNLNQNRFKPKLKLNTEINYGFEDAALTGISSGILHSFSPLMYELSSMLFKVNSYEFIVNPQFNNPMLNIRILSIISINLAKIMYMLCIIYLK